MSTLKSSISNSNTNRKPENIIGSYNSLKDPHLRVHFRKPQIRRHLLQADIINKDNKIVEEISSTKHQQNVERKQKRELYQMLNELVGVNGQVDSNPEKLLNDAKVILNGSQSNHYDSRNPQRTLLIQKLDRMIKAIKEHHEQTSVNSRPIQNGIIKSNLRTAKSQHDVRLELSNQNVSNESLKTYRSTPQLSKNLERPKSSYGRTRKGLTDNNHNSSFYDSTTSRQNKLKKCTSLANIQNRIQDCDDDDFDEIKSLDGESFDDSDLSDNNDDGNGGSKPKLPLLDSSPIMLLQKKQLPFPNWSSSKKYYAFDRRFMKSSTNQKVKMTFRYNGLNGATNHGGKRNVKVFQQIHVGGNSILIYDGFVNPGETFSFDVRPHLNDSFAINVLVNGIRDLRLNTCCERKHRPGTTLSHFTIVNIVGGRACFNCRLLGSSSTTTSETNEFITADDDEYKTIDGANFRNNEYDLHGYHNSTNNENHSNGKEKDIVKQQDEQEQDQNQSNIHLDRDFSPKSSLPRLSPAASLNIMEVNGQQEQNIDHKNNDETNEMENHNHESIMVENNDLYCKNDQLSNLIPVINDNGTDLVGQDIGDETMPQVENVSTDDDEEEQEV